MLSATGSWFPAFWQLAVGVGFSAVMLGLVQLLLGLAIIKRAHRRDLPAIARALFERRPKK
ncbi:hypothetical protein [Kribbella ginsengisoli]|uniref:Uncharacterized protein n=1 Tax=Kribbella ginsengisoli TaxID=363865 RepID=A0ABP6WGF0_9ACTN